MNNKVDMLNNLYRETKKNFAVVKELAEKEIDGRVQDNLASIEDYLMSRFPEIRELDFRINVAHDEYIVGYCLVFCGCWLVTESGVYYDKSSDHYIGKDNYYRASSKHNWIPLRHLPKSKATDPMNGLFARWKEMKAEVDTDFEKRAEQRMEKLQGELKRTSERMNAVKNFKL